MSWKAYFTAFAVHSPVHVGYHNVSHAHRTRYYVPGGNMMSAFASAIDVPGKGINAEILREVKKYFVFSTFFVSRNGRDPLFPVLTEEGDLFYGKERLSLWDFTNQFISAKEGRKYDLGQGHSDLEFIVPENNVKKTQNYLVGYIFVSDNGGEDRLSGWLRSLRELYIGEETVNRMGNVQLMFLEKIVSDDNKTPFFSLEGIYLDWSGERVKAVYEKTGPLLGYLKAGDGSSFVGIYGVQESTEGRIDLLKNVMSADEASGKCWVPGTLVRPGEKGSVFIMGYDGILMVKTKG